MTRDSDVCCRNELYMNRNVFDVLCEMLTNIRGLHASKNMSIEEIVATFVYTLSHHQKNRTNSHYLLRRGESVSRHFNHYLRELLKLHEHLLTKPTPIADDCEDERWKCFKNCLGAFDGTYISVTASSEKRGRYRTRNGHIALNVLGSAHDGRVLRDALYRPDGLKVPKGSYYLVDGGYANCEGFLAPYRNQCYHLKEWGSNQLGSAEEYFNMKHAKARNGIERCFGIFKGKLAILRIPSIVYPIQTQSRLVLGCCLLHNLIRRLMPTDLDEDIMSEKEEEDEEEEETEFITTIETSYSWTNFRNTLAQDMFNSWRARHG